MIDFNNKIVQEDMEDLVSRKIDFSKLDGKTVLITGANGMLATYMVYFFMYLNIKKIYNIKVLALVRNKIKAEGRFGLFVNNPSFLLLEQDVCEPVDYDGDIHFIIHAAGNASPKYILSDPVGIIEANVKGTLNILELAGRKKTERVLYTSTREVYGRMPEDAVEISETDSGTLDFTELRACYPESKRMAETLLKSYSYQYHIPYVSVRLAFAYGPGMEIDGDGRVLADFVSDVVNRRNITLKSTGDAVRSFCYITDAVAGIMLALLHGTPGEAYNLANEDEEMKIRDIAKMATEAFPELNLEVIFDIPAEQSLGYSKMGRTRLSTEKLKRIGWRCSVPFRIGIKRTIKSFVSY